jgi:2-polyprenyl-3-methyl-5-hydroxy-6-metoxy-1,4-benzoquinol methylase
MSTPAAGDCLVCAASNVTPWATVRTDHGSYRLVRCASCRSAYVHPRPDLEFIEAYYRSKTGTHSFSDPDDVLAAERAYPNSTVDARRMVANIRAMVGTGTRRLLDVGAGFGLFAREAVAAGFDVDCVEVGTFERRCIRQFAGVEATPVMFEDFDGSPSSYGAVLMSQILEHTVDPQRWVSKAAGLLRPGGVLAIAVPNFESLFVRILGSREMHISPPEHLNFFSLAGLDRLLSAQGMVIEKSESITRLPFSHRMRGPLRFPLRAAETAFCAAADAIGMGTYLNVYAVRRGES